MSPENDTRNEGGDAGSRRMNRMLMRIEEIRVVPVVFSASRELDFLFEAERDDRQQRT